jgi:hypothetical protein
MATWSLISGRSRSMHSVQALTEGAPAVGDGVDITLKNLGGVGTVIPVLRAPAGETFTGAGMIRAWLYVPVLGRWVRAPRADDDLSDATGLGEAALTAVKIAWTAGRFALTFDGAVVSAGAAPELDMVCVAHGGDEI